MNILLPFSARLTLTLVIAIIGIAQLSAQESLERYDRQYRAATLEIERLTKTLQRKLAINPDSGLEEREDLLKLRGTQMKLLDTLISLNPESQNYRFEMAKLTAARGDKELSTRILEELAPLEKRGYSPAHLVLAQFYFDSRPASGFEQQQVELNRALKHIDHVLTDDVENLNAKLLKAKILTASQKYEPAYQLYDNLLETNPNVYREMLELNKQMGREEREREVCEKALASFQKIIKQEAVQADDRRWVAIESGISRTMQQLNRHEEAESRLEGLIDSYSADSSGGPRAEFLRRLLAGIYVDWASKLVDPGTRFDSLPEATLSKQLDLYAKAYQNYSGNTYALQSLARLSQSENKEIAEKAKAVYDAEADPNPQPAVLNQLGNLALLSEDFSKAIRHYERAREKAPRDPAILNNLGYCYLVAKDEDRDADRALQLIDEALQYLPEGLDPAETSKFLHTKATALKQLDRLADAIEVYEQSLEPRPDHVDTLESLIECYQGLDKQPPAEYAARLEKLDQ